jgi:hypothetical protein
LVKKLKHEKFQQKMDLFFRRPSEFSRDYNCSFYSVEQLPESKRTHRFFGLTIIVVGIVAEVSFLFCFLG